MAKKIVAKKLSSASQKKQAKINRVDAKDVAINRSFSENAVKMMKKRYLYTRKDGSQETPAEMFHP